MPVDTEKIKKALDDFEEDNYVDSEKILTKEIKKAKNNYFKKELELENDIEQIKQDPDDIKDGKEE